MKDVKAAGDGGRLAGVDFARLLLMLGVIVIHSNVCDGALANIEPGATIVSVISGTMMRAIVPCFFVLSGFFIYRGVGRLTPSAYVGKLRSRVATLLVPYLLWNLIASCLLIVKARWLGYPGFGVIDAEGFHPLAYLGGFWSVYDGYPFDFVLWFLRNLIVFVVVSPLFYIVARYRWMFAIYVACTLLFDNFAEGGFWFCLGIFLSFNPSIVEVLKRRAVGSLAFVVWVALSVAMEHGDMPDCADSVIRLVHHVAAFSAVLTLGEVLGSRWRVPALLGSSVFFVYAFHGLYNGLLRETIVKVFAVSDTAGMLAAYVTTIVAITLTALAGYWLCLKVLPGVARVLTGSR